MERLSILKLHEKHAWGRAKKRLKVSHFYNFTRRNTTARQGDPIGMHLMPLRPPFVMHLGDRIGGITAASPAAGAAPTTEGSRLNILT